MLRSAYLALCVCCIDACRGLAHRRAQFQRFGLLLLRNLNGLQETHFWEVRHLGVGGAVWRSVIWTLDPFSRTPVELLEDQFSFQPIQFGLLELLPSFIDIARASASALSLLLSARFPCASASKAENTTVQLCAPVVCYAASPW